MRSPRPARRSAGPALLAIPLLWGIAAAMPASAVSLAAGGGHGVAQQVTSSVRCGLQTPIVDEQDAFALLGADSITSRPLSAGGSFDCQGADIAYSVAAGARADLASGTLGVGARADGAGSASGEAWVQDVIMLDGIAMDLVAVFIPITVTGLSLGNVITGIFEISARTPGPQGELIDFVQVALSPAAWEDASAPTGPDLPRTHTTGLAFDVPASVGAFELTMRAEVGVVADGVAAFFESAAIQDIVVPEGVTWTSESGVFLTVAEPGTGALLAAAALLGTLARRRRR